MSAFKVLSNVKNPFKAIYVNMNVLPCVHASP